MAISEQDDTKASAAPPYIAFQTLKTLAGLMKEKSVPARIDRSVLTNFSGAVGGQLLTALKFLRLTDSDGAPTQALRDLVKAHGTDAWTVALNTTIKAAYEPLFELDLKQASPAQFTEKFRQAYPGKDETLRKCMTFFLNAAREAETPISQYIMFNKKPRTLGAKRRNRNGEVDSRGPLQSPAGKEDGGSEKPPAPAPNDDRTPLDVLMKDIYDPTVMQPDEEQAVFTLLRFLKKKAA